MHNLYLFNTNICNFLFLSYKTSTKKSKRSQGNGTGLKRGDEVITSGGIIGIVDKVHDDDKIDVMLSDNVKVQIIKSTITSLLKKEVQKIKGFCA